MILAALYQNRYLPHARRALKPATVREYSRLAEKLLIPRFGAREVERITLDAVEEFHAEVPGPVQANRAVTLLSAILSFAVRRKLLKVNPCHGFEHRHKEKSHEFFYTPIQTTAILAAALGFRDIRGKYIALELLAGCRPNELRDVAPAWWTPGAVRTPDGKTGGRTIFLSPQAEAILNNLSAIHSRPRDAHAGCYFPAEMDLRRAWYTIMETARVPYARLYDLRHTFASAALASGTGLDVVGLMLGHRKRETTLRYAHLAPDIGVNAAAAAAVRMGA